VINLAGARTQVIDLFGVHDSLHADHMQRIFGHQERQLARPEFSPSVLFRSFGLDVLYAAEVATGTVAVHCSGARTGFATFIYHAASMQ
jgi:glucuronate isomerase